VETSDSALERDGDGLYEGIADGVKLALEDCELIRERLFIALTLDDDVGEREGPSKNSTLPITPRCTTELSVIKFTVILFPVDTQTPGACRTVPIILTIREDDVLGPLYKSTKSQQPSVS
jgi:hypothetical protein